ncbi:MAG: peptide-methionine (S)-S-oxide reductase MsrA [Nanoarchaeota archaeon]|nr:peptide-methionine (S)-S-oxide reductase MsrA [Nanoarchaeota archaeon]
MRKITILVVLLTISLFIQGCSSTKSNSKNSENNILFDNIKKEFNISGELSTAVFSGGCFWCVEKDFEKIEGVVEVISGYTSNNSNDIQPTYEQVASGKTQFRESVLVIYNSSIISYTELVDYFLRHHDPTDEGGSFYDRGFQYSSAIYFKNLNEKNEALNVISFFEESQIYTKPIITSVEELVNFFIAENYHQDYYKKNPIRYSLYRRASGRDNHINTISSRIEKLEDS